jgi:hypothetical protein
VFREFATAPPASGPLDAALSAARDVLGVLSGATNTTDNASVSLQAVGPGGGRLLAVSETPKASYIVDPATLATLEKVGGVGAGAAEARTARAPARCPSLPWEAGGLARRGPPQAARGPQRGPSPCARPPPPVGHLPGRRKG